MSSPIYKNNSFVSEGSLATCENEKLDMERFCQRIKKLVKPNFTSKQLQIIELVANCCTNEEIAQILLISPETVKSHLKKIYRKIDPSDIHLGSSVCRVMVAVFWMKYFANKVHILEKNNSNCLLNKNHLSN